MKILVRMVTAVFRWIHNIIRLINHYKHIYIIIMSDNINVTIKCSNADKAEMTIDKTITVLELKTLIEAKLSVAAAQQR